MSNNHSISTPTKNSPDNYKRICDGYDCQDEPCRKMKVNCGRFGIIALDLCENCSKLFME